MGGGPDIDIYALCDTRNEEIILKFINKYIDLEKENNAENFKSGKVNLMSLISGEPDEWEPAVSIEHLIKRGLDYPRRAFCFYMNNVKISGIDCAIVKFTTDDKVILGLSIDDSDESDKNVVKARGIFQELMKTFECRKGYFTGDVPPPDNESEFDYEMNEHSVEKMKID